MLTPVVIVTVLHYISCHRRLQTSASFFLCPNHRLTLTPFYGPKNILITITTIATNKTNNKNEKLLFCWVFILWFICIISFNSPIYPNILISVLFYRRWKLRWLNHSWWNLQVCFTFDWAYSMPTAQGAESRSIINFRCQRAKLGRWQNNWKL